MSVYRDGKFFKDLYERIKHVQFLNRDALKILDRIKDDKDYLIYVDPPYEKTSTELYGQDNQVDHGALMDILKVQKGKVAVSGYGTSYDALGWERHEKKVRLKAGIIQKVNASQPNRTEVLWTNYQPKKMPTLFDSNDD